MLITCLKVKSSQHFKKELIDNILIFGFDNRSIDSNIKDNNTKFNKCKIPMYVFRRRHYIWVLHCKMSKFSYLYLI